MTFYLIRAGKKLARLWLSGVFFFFFGMFPIRRLFFSTCFHLDFKNWVDEISVDIKYCGHLLR